MKTIDIKCNGGTLRAWVGDDGCAIQAGVSYVLDNDTAEIDICMAEVKGPELTKNPDNKDIDIYVYEDVFREEWTKTHTIRHEDIVEALKDD